METSRSATTEPVKQEDWENPKVQRTGTEPPRASFFAFPNREQALRNEPEDSEWMLSLAGDWLISVVAGSLEPTSRLSPC